MPRALFAVTAPTLQRKPKSPLSKPPATAFMPTITVTQVTQLSIHPPALPQLHTPVPAKLFSPISSARTSTTAPHPQNVTSNPNPPWFLPTHLPTTLSTLGATPTATTLTAPTPLSSGPPLVKRLVEQTQISGSAAGQKCKYFNISILCIYNHFPIFTL